MSDDAYTKWLGLPEGPRPPQPIELLGLKPGARDRASIDRAAAKCMDRLDQYVLSSDPAARSEVQELMNRVARARTELVAALPAEAEQTKAEPPQVPPATPAPPARQPTSAKPTQPTPPRPPSTRAVRPISSRRQPARPTRNAHTRWLVPLLGGVFILTLSGAIVYFVLLSDGPGSATTGGLAAARNDSATDTPDNDPADPTDPTPSDPEVARDPEPAVETFARPPELQAYIDQRDSLDMEAKIELVRQTLSQYNGGMDIRLEYETTIGGELYFISLANGRSGSSAGTDDQITDLSPLAGLDLWRLELVGLTRLESLEPLRGVPLQSIQLRSCTRLRDLSALAGMPLTRVEFENLSVTDFSALRGKPLRWLDLNNCSGLDSLEPFRGMPLFRVMLVGCEQVVDLSPLSESPVQTLSIIGTGVTDLAPVRDMPLQELDMKGCFGVTDLSPLAGKRINTIWLDGTGVSDLTPLRGMSIRSIGLEGCPNLTSLDGLEGMDLDNLKCARSIRLQDISALAGMTVKQEVNLSHTQVHDLSPLGGLEFHTLSLEGCTSLISLDGLEGLTAIAINCKGCENLEDISALADAVLTRSATLSGTLVRDFTPLRHAACLRLWLDDCPNLDSLEWAREMPNLQTIYLRNSGYTPERYFYVRNSNAQSVRLVTR